MSSDDDSSVRLLKRARSGDPDAIEQLCGRYMEPLRRWATGRLPIRARGVIDTDDLVQETVVKTLGMLHTFEPRRQGALHAYLRTVLLNRIRDELRRADRRPRVELRDVLPDAGPSPLEVTIGAESLARYERVLSRFRSEERELVVARVELNMTYEQIASALGRPSVEAVRKAIARALLRLAREMAHDA
jgi:RNA polymerase sigma-70 factor (ECF subfamily)